MASPQPAQALVPLGRGVVEAFSQEQIDACEESVTVRVLNQQLKLSLLLKEDELAPLFSGAAWAGTLLWDAELLMVDHFLVQYEQELQRGTLDGVIELGSGIGVSGMALRIAGAQHVVLTEQPDLIELMQRNLHDNATVLRLPVSSTPESLSPAKGIVARELSWGTHQTREYLVRHNDESIAFVLSCDCIYEPLYGTSWRDLARTMELFCQTNPKCVVIMSVERRNQDGIDKFLQFVDRETTIQWQLRERRIGNTNNRLELYYLTLDNATPPATAPGNDKVNNQQHKHVTNL